MGLRDRAGGGSLPREGVEGGGGGHQPKRRQWLDEGRAGKPKWGYVTEQGGGGENGGGEGGRGH